MQQNGNPWTPGQIRLLGVIVVLVITCFIEITVKEVSAHGSTDYVDYVLVAVVTVVVGIGKAGKDSSVHGSDDCGRASPTDRERRTWQASETS
jgi:hypothetical protein